MLWNGGERLLKFSTYTQLNNGIDSLVCAAQFTLVNRKMKYRRTLICIFLCVYLTSLQNTAGYEQEKVFNFGSYQKSLQSRRQNNATNFLKSAKLKQGISTKHAELHVEHFATRLNHFSTDDLRTVEFVRMNCLRDILLFICFI